MPSPIRRWGRAAVAAALLLGMLPTTALAAASGTVTIDATIPPGCQIDANRDELDDRCLVDDAVEFVVVAANTGDATLTHVNLSVPVGPSAVSGSDGLASVATSAGTCRQSGTTVSCSISELRSGAAVTVRLGFDPTDHADQYLETVAYDAVISMTAKAATKSGQKQNFEVTCACADSATFLLAAEDDENTTTYTAGDNTQQAQVTAPLLEGTKFFVFAELISRAEGEFCGDPGLTLGTCFGKSVHVEVEDQTGASVVFEDCDLSAALRDGSCIRIDIAWDPDDSGMLLLYQLTPSLITVYHDGTAVPKCDALVSPPEDADPARACSEPASVLGPDDPRGPAGWIGVTIYTDRNGNWGAG